MSKVYCSVYNGIGNQLFCYALGLYVSKKTHKELYVDLTKLNTINFLSLVKIKKDTPRKYEIPKLGFNPPVIQFNIQEFTRKIKILNQTYIADFRNDTPTLGDVKSSQDIYTIGWGNFSNVKDILPDMRSRFQPNFKISPSVANTLKIIKENNSVALHIRRTDYLHQKIGKRFDGICTKKYYQNAIQHIMEQVHNPYFIVFSDDMEYVVNNIEIDNSHFVFGNPGYVDLYLMSACKNFILANSTFGFWAAILNKSEQKVVCVPEYWYNNPLETEEFIPEEWTKISIRS
jgi:hypothetical protein